MNLLAYGILLMPHAKANEKMNVIIDKRGTPSPTPIVNESIPNEFWKNCLMSI